MMLSPARGVVPPSLYENSSKVTKEVKAKTIKNHRGTKIFKNNKTFRPMSTLADMGLKVFFHFFLCFWFPQWFLIVVALTSFVVLVSLGFQLFLIFSNVHLVLRKGSDVDALLCWIRHSLYTSFHIYKMLPCIIGSPLQVIPLIFTRGSPCINYFPVSGNSLYRDFHLARISRGCPF